MALKERSKFSNNFREFECMKMISGIVYCEVEIFNYLELTEVVPSLIYEWCSYFQKDRETSFILYSFPLFRLIDWEIMVPIIVLLIMLGLWCIRIFQKMIFIDFVSFIYVSCVN